MQKTTGNNKFNWLNKNIVGRLNVKDFIMIVVIFLVTFRGFIDNFIMSGTLLVDCLFVIIAILCVIALFTGAVNKNFNRKYLIAYIFWFAICCINALWQVLLNKTSVYNALIGIRTNNVYTLLILFVTIFCNREDIKNYYKLFINFGIIICSFALFQFLGRNWLPENLLILNGEDIFTLYESGIIRVTRLMGNTIIFGGYAVVLFSLVWAELIVHSFRPAILWLKIAIIVSANMLTFSRASVVGMVGVMSLELLIFGSARGKLLKYMLTMLAIILIALILALTVFRDSVIVQRIFGFNSSWTDGSDEGHFTMIGDAINAIKQNWLFGTMMGVSNEIITDGSFWAYIIEWGIPVFVVYCVLICMLLIRALKNLKRKDRWAMAINIGYVGMNAYFFVFSFINSAYASRSILVFVWLIAGMMLVTSNRGYENINRKEIINKV